MCCFAWGYNRPLCLLFFSYESPRSFDLGWDFPGTFFLLYDVRVRTIPSPTTSGRREWRIFSARCALSGFTRCVNHERSDFIFSCACLIFSDICSDALHCCLHARNRPQGDFCVMLLLILTSAHRESAARCRKRGTLLAERKNEKKSTRWAIPGTYIERNQSGNKYRKKRGNFPVHQNTETDVKNTDKNNKTDMERAGLR